MRRHLQIECNEMYVDDCKVIPSVQICGHAKHPQIERSEICGNSSIGRATAFQAVGCGFETRYRLQGVWEASFFFILGFGGSEIDEK